MNNITFNAVEPVAAVLTVANVRFWSNKVEVKNWNVRAPKIEADRVQLEGWTAPNRYGSLFIDAEEFNGLHAGKYDKITAEVVVIGESDDIAGQKSTYRKVRLEPSDYMLNVEANSTGLKRPFPQVVPAEEEDIDG